MRFLTTFLLVVGLGAIHGACSATLSTDKGDDGSVSEDASHEGLKDDTSDVRPKPDGDIAVGADTHPDGVFNDGTVDGAIDGAIDGPIPSKPEVPGVRPVTPSPLSEGTLFAAPKGIGTSCAQASPCDIWQAAKIAKGGDVVFLRQGSYDIDKNLDFRTSGTAASPVVFESYPGENATLDGSSRARGTHVFIQVRGDFITLRRLAIVSMPRQGLIIRGNHNIVEGLEVHGCSLTGIHIAAGYDYPYGKTASFNTIRDCTIYDNSDAGRSDDGFANGGNADGISVSNGLSNVVRHCLVHHNSDDGVDTWRSEDSYVGYVISHHAGIADGNGHGIKAGGADNSQTTLVEHCLSFSNQKSGFTYNSGANVRFLYNTAYGNGSYGYVPGPTTLARYNIAAGNGHAPSKHGLPLDNSWQRTGKVTFISTSPGAVGFLQPVKGSAFADIGAFAGASVVGTSTFPRRDIFVIGDSTVDNKSSGEAGWANVLPAFARRSTRIHDRAQSGASSRSFYDSLWSPVRKDLTAGAILLIQFGHNDEHSDTAHHTDPGTAPAYLGSYRDFLTHFVKEARAAGARPILITPVSRMTWSSGHPSRSHGDYPKAVRKIASDLGVKLLDLEEKSWKIFDALGETETVKTFSYDDRTHFTPEGAMRVAQIVKDLACPVDKELCEQLLP